MSEKQLIATYDRDSKRYHRYLIGESEGITGAIYIPKGQDIPKQVTIKLQVKEN